MHLDATGLPVLDHAAPGGKRLGTRRGYVGDEVAAYVYASMGKKLGQSRASGPRSQGEANTRLILTHPSALKRSHGRYEAARRAPAAGSSVIFIP
jgi:hypothetical protein